MLFTGCYHNYLISVFKMTRDINHSSPFKFYNDRRLHIDNHTDISCAGKHTRIVKIINGEEHTLHPLNKPMKSFKM